MGMNNQGCKLSDLYANSRDPSEDSKRTRRLIYKKQWARLEKIFQQDLSIIHKFNIFEKPNSTSQYNVLHWACEFKAPTPLIKLILSQNPNLLREKDYRKRLPLHVAIKAGLCLDSVICLIQNYPDSVIEEDGEGFNAIEHALFSNFCCRNNSQNMIQLLQCVSIRIHEQRKKELQEMRMNAHLV